MPSPFNKKPTQTKEEPDILQVLNSSLVCEHCFDETTEGKYSRKEKTLYWNCAHCGKRNVVKGVEL